MSQNTTQSNQAERLPFNEVEADCIQQFVNQKLVQLPMLLVDGKLTGITGAKPVATVKIAHEIAQGYADKLLATKNTTSKYRLTKPQQNILSIVLDATRKTKGKNKGDLKDSVSSDSFDGRSFGALVDKGLIKDHDGIFGQGFVATNRALAWM